MYMRYSPNGVKTTDPTGDVECTKCQHINISYQIT